MSDVPEGLKYTKEHEWARFEAGKVTVGVTAFAVEQLGDVTLVSVDAKPGDTLVPGKAFGTIESVKTLSDLFAPVGGTLVAVNEALVERPELINQDCYGAGWMVVLSTTDDGAGLMDAAAYRQHLSAAR